MASEVLRRKRILEKLCLDIQYIRLAEAIKYLDIPNYSPNGKRVYGEHTGSIRVLWDHLSDIGYMKDNFLLTQLHSGRVALTTIKIGDFLRLPLDDKQALFIAGLNHDVGKFLVNYSEDGEGLFLKSERIQLGSNEEFTPEDLEISKFHVICGADFASNEKVIRSLILRHHFWQRNPYPTPEEIMAIEEGKCQTNPILIPRIEFLSFLLALADFHDATSTRPVKSKSGFLPRLEVKKRVISEYGERQIPGDNRTAYYAAGELVERLYEEHIFGRSNHFNPFLARNSFRWKRFSLDKLIEKLMV